MGIPAWSFCQRSESFDSCVPGFVSFLAYGSPGSLHEMRDHHPQSATPHTLITEADVKVRQVAPEMLAQDSLAGPADAVDKLSTTDIARGEPVLSRRLIAPDYVGPRAALVMEPGELTVAFPAQDLPSSVVVDPGKASSGSTATLQTVSVLQDVRVAAIIRNNTDDAQSQQGRGTVRAILLAVAPQDALLLKHSRDAGAVPDLALPSPPAEGTFDVVPVDTDYLSNRYDIVDWRAVR